ncbi:MAG: ABC transporter substrate-binding protein [Archangium sp.]
MRALVLAGLLTLAGCRSSSSSDASVASSVTASAEWLNGTPVASTGTPQRGGTLVVRVMTEPATLNYLDDSSFEANLLRLLSRNVVETLVELNADGTLGPGLATGWTESSDHLVTTFTLREAKFSDGSAFTSKDVVATCAVILDVKRPTAGIRGELATLSGCEAIDEHTVAFKWKSVSVFALRALARVPMYSAARLAGDWTELGQKPVGTGPWVVSSWERGQKLTLKRRADATSGYLDSVVFRFVKDHTAAGAMFEKGEFDLMTNITPALWRALEKNDATTVWAKRDWNRLKNFDNSFSYVAWNERHPPFDDVRVRRALQQLYDAKLVSKVIDLELEVPTNCPYYPGSASCSKSLPVRSFDPTAARAILGDAGFEDRDGDGVRERDGKPLKFSFLLPASSVRLGRLVPMLQEQYRAAGVDLEVERVETATLSARINKRDFEVMSRVWTEFDQDQDLFQLFHSSQIDGGSNYASISDPQIDQLIEQIRGEFDLDKRRALERQLHERLYELQPLLLMTNRQSLDAAKKRVHGLVPSVAWYDLRKVWVQD